MEHHDPATVEAVELGGVRTFISVPLLKENELIGTFSLARQEIRPFSNKQIALVTNFAAQAVIAIENARLLNELRHRTTDLTERTDDLTEALEQQTATSEVLRVISSSPGDLEPVFSTMLGNAVRICGATFGNIYQRDGEAFRIVTSHNAPPAFVEALKRFPYISGKRMVATKSPIHVADATTQPFYTEGRDPEVVAAVELGRVRTFLAVPMVKDGEVIGAFLLNRQEVRPFTDKQIELVQNFAAQAVIAIENARLLNELRQRTADLAEALEQQTATSEVLQVISGSPGDLQPVFAAMLENAARICDANFGNIFRWDGDALWLVATHNTPPAFIEHRSRVPFRPDQANPIGEMLKANAAIHVADLARDERYIQKRDPEVVAAVELGGIRTFVAVPMLKDEKLIGAVILYRQEVRPFSDKQIELVKNFAAQAVIAIENARLLSELRQSLEQQTATSEVLQVISASPGELEPVFTTMLEKAVRICDAKYGSLYLHEDGKLRLVAAHDVPEFLEARRGVAFEPAPGGGLDEAMRTKRAIQIPDLAATKPYLERHPGVVEAFELAGIRTGMTVPMLKDDEVIGVIAIHRREVLAFTGKQVELLTNFAAQAVIAIENARLLNELRQSLEQQTATADVLKVISRSTFDLQKVLDTLVTSAAELCRAERASITVPKGERYHRVASFGFSAEFRDFLDRHPLVVDRGNIVGRVVLEGGTIQIEDVEVDPEFTFKEALQIGKARTLLGVPLMRQGKPIGVLVLTRSAVEPFTRRHIELVETFADQAVIAIENARLLNELRERTEEVEKLNNTWNTASPTK